MTDTNRRTAVVAEYLELMKANDEQACMNYLVECFGNPESEEMDKEGFESFSVAILEAANADASEVEAEVAVEEVVTEEEVKDEANA